MSHNISHEVSDTKILKAQGGFLVKEEFILDHVMLWGWPEQK